MTATEQYFLSMVFIMACCVALGVCIGWRVAVSISDFQMRLGDWIDARIAAVIGDDEDDEVLDATEVE